MDGGFARSIVRPKMVPFSLTLTVTILWFGINILDVWSRIFAALSARSDTVTVLRINAGLAANDGFVRSALGAPQAEGILRYSLGVLRGVRRFFPLRLDLNGGPAVFRG